MFSPDERVLLSGKGSIEQPMAGNGEMYLTDKRIFLAHKSGLIKKRETPLLDVEVSQVTYAKTEGSLRKVLVVGVRGTGGQVITYKIHVSGPQSWVSQIYSLKGGAGVGARAEAAVQPAHQGPAGSSGARFCKHCGNEIDADSTFCSACGKHQ
jgi:hypothetical protein